MPLLRQQVYSHEGYVWQPRWSWMLQLIRRIGEVGVVAGQPLGASTLEGLRASEAFLAHLIPVGVDAATLTFCLSQPILSKCGQTSLHAAPVQQQSQQFWMRHTAQQGVLSHASLTT